MKHIGIRTVTRRTLFTVVGLGASLSLASPPVNASTAPGAGTFTTVDAPGAGTASGQGTILQGIAQNGVLVGIYEDTGCLDHGFTDRSGALATLNDPSAATGSVPCPNTGQGTNAYADNGRTVVGDYLDSSGVFHGFTLERGLFATLDDPNAGSASGQGTMPFAVDASGEIVGAYIDASGVQHGFLFVRGAFSDFNYPGGQGTALTAISAAGVLVGSYVDAGGVTRSFTYYNGRFTQYDDPNAAVGETFATSVNDQGTVVGDYVDSAGLLHGFVFEGGSYSTIDDPNGAGGTALAGINDSGVMDGYYIDAQGVYHGLVFRPL